MLLQNLSKDGTLDGERVLNCCSSGASGGANKGPAVIDKRNQVLECPHCDREFKQVQRYREHIAKKHPDEQATDSADSTAEHVSDASKVHRIPRDAGHAWHLFLALNPQHLELHLQITHPTKSHQASNKRNVSVCVHLLHTFTAEWQHNAAWQ